MAVSWMEVRRYTHNHETLLLNIGAQKNRPKGWLNIDTYPTFGAVYMDATNMRSLRTASFSAVLCEHMIEHVPKPTALSICKEIHRILKPGGVSRFVTPDMHRMCAVLAAPTDKERQYVALTRRYLGRPELSDVDVVNIMFRNYGHQYIYTRAELCQLLADAGFTATTVTSADDCDNPIFRNAQGHGRLVGEDLNSLEAFGIEAQKK